MGRPRHEPGSSATAADGVPAPRGGAAGAPAPVDRGRGRPAGPVPAARVLIVAGCAVALVYVALLMAGVVAAFPAVWAGAFLIGAATLVFGYWLLRRIRPVRAPGRAASSAAVAWGLFAVTGAALVANAALDGVLAVAMGPRTADLWGAAVSGPVDEELLKLAGVVLVAVAFPYAVRGPVDGFVIGALVGLGFQVMENLFMAVQEVTGRGGLGGVEMVVQSGLTRVLLTGLGTHWALSAVAGTAVGLVAAAAWRPRPRTVAAAVLLVVLAMAMHAFINLPVLQGIGVVVKALVNFAVAMALYFALRRAHLRRLRDALEETGAESGMDRATSLAQATRGGRRRALRGVPADERAALGAEQDRLVGEAESRAFERGSRAGG
ncbi:Protease prsW family protein [Nocardiopsis flavescens]|uniref:Protease prsW family protein n=1 Tax=Nocardiopsis flavescens TaxID=758803 RepID=A0A1M6V2I8_9ACTN|nr:PrsW family glutamic-type intramembrane protease [Nocardiopsis flavescens]SHK75722.1 Protease prsW family protein [Nocardiopsis flavescens]